jgi:PRTRC genetic system ThiF family protein
MKPLPNIHFVDNYLLHPANPVIVNIIGAGGTGSQVLTAMARINHSLTALGHPGLFVQLIDDDTVTEANLGRQLFAHAELGRPKSVALINRVNRFFGTNWKAIPYRYTAKTLYRVPGKGAANITLTCVDTVTARFDIAGILSGFGTGREHDLYKPIYWMDFGNSRYTGQVLLSTIGEVKQPASRKYRTVAHLPFITEQYKDLLTQSAQADTPSCSLAEALSKQDLFINSTLASMGASLFWNLLREGMTENRGFFVSLKDFRTQPLKVCN